MITNPGIKELTPFNHIFGGRLLQEIVCGRCKKVSQSEEGENFGVISLDIKQTNTIQNIQNILANYFEEMEVGELEDRKTWYSCDDCRDKVQAKQQFFIEKPPPVLCLHLKRFAVIGTFDKIIGYRKIQQPIELSRSLNIAPYMKNQQKEVNYRLRSSIIHDGSTPTQGHYFAFGEGNKGQFFEFNDPTVRSVGLPKVLNSESYVVFYEITPESWSDFVPTTTNVATG